MYHSLRTDIQYNIDSILSFSISFTPFWHLVYHSIHIEFQCIIHSVTTSMITFTPSWQSVYHSIHTDIHYIFHSVPSSSITFFPYWHLLYHLLLTDIQYEGRLIRNAHSEIFCQRSKVAMSAQCFLVATSLLHSGAKFHFFLYTGSKTVRVNMESCYGCISTRLKQRAVTEFLSIKCTFSLSHQYINTFYNSYRLHVSAITAIFMSTL